MNIANRISILLYIVLVFEIHSKLCTAQTNRELCGSNEDCKENAFCHSATTSNKCKCNKGYKLFRNSTSYQCLQVIELGEPCKNHGECQRLSENAICNSSGVCQCTPDSHNYGGKCFMTAKLDEICMTKENCYIEDNTGNWTITTCVNGMCKCNSGQVPSKDKNRCLTVKKLGEACINDDECSLQTPNSVCLAKCQCDEKYVESRDSSNCTKAAEQFGDPCEIDAQCSKFLIESICDNEKCTCSPNSHSYDNNRCVITRRIGESCEDDANCLYDKNLETTVKCQEGTCQCLYGENEDGSCNVERVPVNKKVDDNSSAIKITNLIYFNFLFVPMLVKFCY